jgi:hypothetical protein
MNYFYSLVFKFILCFRVFEDGIEPSCKRGSGTGLVTSPYPQQQQPQKILKKTTTITTTTKQR